MTDNKLHPAVRWCRTIALWLFVLTTWGVAVFFVIDFWPYIRQLSLFQVLLALVLVSLFALISLILWAGQIVTFQQILKFVAVMFFFLAMATLYSYVGMRLGLFVRDLFGLETMSAALS